MLDPQHDGRDHRVRSQLVSRTERRGVPRSLCVA